MLKRSAVLLGAGAALAVSVALASVAHIYPGSGQTYHSPTIAGTAQCGLGLPGYSFQYSHQTSTTISASGSSPLTVDKIGSWAGWENAPDNFLWGVVWVVDGTNSSNSEAYVDQIGYAFTNMFHQWVYKQVSYAPTRPAYISYKWGDPTDVYCQPITQVVIHGP